MRSLWPTSRSDGQLTAAAISNESAAGFEVGYAPASMNGLQSDGRVPAEWFADLQEVEALHNFDGKSAEDLPFKKKEILTIIRQTRDPMWCYARNADGRQGMIPLNYVKKAVMLQPPQHKLIQMQWFHGKITREEAEGLLLPVGIDGVYLVRESLSYPGDFTLSVTFQGKVEHYHIKAATAANGIIRYTLDELQWFTDLAELLEAYAHSREEGLCTVLRKALPKRSGGRPLSGIVPIAMAPAVLTTVPPALQAATGMTGYVIDTKALEQGGRSLAEGDLQIGEAIGKGEFGEVLKGSYRGTVVAVKKLRQDTRAAQSVVQEALLMSAMKHENLVAFVGIVRRQDSIFIVTEYMAKGSLVEHLRNHGRASVDKHMLLRYTRDTCSGMAYLEEQQVVHRDLAARNVLISEDNLAKVSDFGLALYASEQREEDCDSKFPIKWTAPEALRHGLFTSKSDVWSFGILLWEIYTYGRNPYPRIPLADVTACVEHGYQNEQPEECPASIYAIMKSCWHLDAAKRPSFSTLREQLTTL